MRKDSFVYTTQTNIGNGYRNFKIGKGAVYLHPVGKPELTKLDSILRSFDILDAYTDLQFGKIENTRQELLNLVPFTVKKI